MLWALDGRFVEDGKSYANDGTPVQPGSSALIDGTELFELKDHKIPNYEFSSTLNSKAIVDVQISYNLTLECTNNADQGNTLSVNVHMPSEFTIIKATSNEGTYNATTGKWTLVMNGQKATLNFILLPTTANATPYDFIFSLDNNTATLTSTCLVSSSDTGAIATSAVDLSNYPDTIANMQPGKLYTVVTFSRVQETGVTGIFNGVKNNRFSISNGAVTFGSRATQQNVIQKIICTFIYDENYPLIFTRYDQYQSVSTNTEDRIYGLCINEGFNDVYSESTNLLSDPELLLASGRAAEIILPGASESAEYIYKANIPGLTGDKNPFYTGIQLLINSFADVNNNIEVQLVSSTGAISINDSAFIEETDTIYIGDPDEMWDLLDKDLQDKTLEIHFKASNTSQIQQTFSYSNILLYLSYQDDKTIGKLGFTFGNKHLRNYGGILFDDENPGGLNKDIITKNRAKSDGVSITDDSAGGKIITTSIALVDDSLENAQRQLNNIVRWLSPSKNEYNYPEFKPLVFDYDPHRQYMAVLSKEVEVTKDHPKLSLKATFLVPSGVAQSINPRITGASGINNGLSKVWPIITVESNGGSSLSVTDPNTENTITLNAELASGTILTIDCDPTKQTITDSDGTDYMSSIDGNTVFIVLLSKTKYNLTSTGCSIKSVEFTEGF